MTLTENSENKNEKEIVESFIFNDEISDVINQINNHLKPNNIFEISGMGSQEIKHSKILGWLMSSDHEMKDNFFINFLKHTIVFTEEQDYKYPAVVLKKLKEYIYLSSKNRHLIVKFEYKNIDILVIDESNKFVFVIENKVYAQESSEQLAKYRKIVFEDFNGYEQFGIFLTIDGTLPDDTSNGGSENLEFYLVAWYEKIYTILQDILSKNTLTLSIETRIIIEHYMDLLLRRDIVSNNEVKKICEQIWNEKEYKAALEILFLNRPSKAELIRKLLKERTYLFPEKITGDVYNFFFKVDESGFIFRIVYSKNKGLNFAVCATDANKNLTMRNHITILNRKINTNKNQNTQYGYQILSAWYGYQHQDDEIDDLLLENIIQHCITWCKEQENNNAKTN